MLRQIMKKAKSVHGSVSDSDTQKNIIVVKGDIAIFQGADVLVNPIPKAARDLRSAGVVSRSFYQWGQNELQKKYEEAVPPKKFGVDVTITGSAGLIRAKNIFHAATGGYRNKRSLELLTSMIRVCLTEAESLNMTSIAFPTVGCGNRRYRADDVAKCFLEAAKETKLQIYIVAYTQQLYESFTKALHTTKELGKCEQEVKSDVSDRPTSPAQPTASPTKQTVDDELIEMSIHDSAIVNRTPEFMRKIQDLQSKEVQIHFKPGQSTVTLKGFRKPLLEAKQRILKMLSEDIPVSKNIDYIKRTKGAAEYLVALSEEVHISFPDYWQTVSCSDLSISKCDYCEVVEGSPAYAAIEALIMYTWESKLVGAGLDARGLTHSEIFIKKISRIENAYLYTKYQFQLKALAKKAAYKPFSTISDFLGEPEIRTTKFAEAKYLTSRLINEVNEVYLFHGTSNVYEIAKYGIDCRLAGNNVLFGRGAYFAESSTKADQYAGYRKDRNDKRLFMFVARVLLGEPFIAQSARPDFKKAPCSTLDFKKEGRPEDHHPLCDSVIGTHRDSNTRLLFREFIVYHPEQCYPEFLVEYVRE